MIDSRVIQHNNNRAIVLTVQRQPGTNTIEVVDNVKKLLPAFRSQISTSVELNVLYDRSTLIRESMHDVKFTLCLTITLTLAVGFVVDDAIVMLENIVRHMEKGESAMEAAFKGSKEIGFTILSMTISSASLCASIRAKNANCRQARSSRNCAPNSPRPRGCTFLKNVPSIQSC